MSLPGWLILTAEDVLSEFTLTESSAIRRLQGSGSGSGIWPWTAGSGDPFTNMDVICARVIDEVRGYINAGNYTLDDDPRTIPSSLFEDAIAIGRWRLLVSVPMLKQLQTDERKKAFDDAIKKLMMVAAHQFQTDQPATSLFPKTGSWNAENKLIMRTHPVLKPSVQWPEQPTDWANSGIQPPVPVTGALYNPFIVALRNDANSLEALSTMRVATLQLLIIVIGGSESVWQLVSGPADPDNPDGEVQPLDYDLGINNRHWAKTGGL